jgi:hypothetical protein
MPFAIILTTLGDFKIKNYFTFKAMIYLSGAMSCLLLPYQKSDVAQHQLRKCSFACLIQYSQQEQNTESEKCFSYSLNKSRFSSHNLPNEEISAIVELCFRFFLPSQNYIRVGHTGPVYC